MTRDEVLKALLEADKNSAEGPDGILTSFLSRLAKDMTEPLFLLFCQSLDSGAFPNCWKNSFIIPIFKSGQRADIANYRGVANAHAIPKLFEKIITEKLTPVILPHLYSAQHGFEKGKSTATNLVLYSNFLLSNVRKVKQIDAIYTDFKKAFDRVNIRLLLRKLSRMGLNGTALNLAWLVLNGQNATSKNRIVIFPKNSSRF